jgi:hypothetical protein
MGSNPKPLTYHIAFTTTVYGDGSTVTSAISLAPTTNTINLGGDIFTAHLPKTGQWFVAPPTVGSVNTGSVGLSIDYLAKTNPTPEPSSLVLGGLGMGFASLMGWRRTRRNQGVVLA